MRKIFKLLKENEVKNALKVAQREGDKFLGLVEGTRQSRSYFIEYEGSLYPLKAVIKYAQQQNDEIPNNLTFYPSQSIKWLQNNKFNVIYKPTISPETEQKELERTKALYETLCRPGQAKFRARVLKLYEFTCAITGCRVLEVLDAAHVKEVKTGGREHVNNGLLLRADLHRLFDRGLLAIDPRTMKPSFAEECGLHYKKFKNIKIPVGGPDSDAFVDRWNAFLENKAIVTSEKQ